VAIDVLEAAAGSVQGRHHAAAGLVVIAEHRDHGHRQPGQLGAQQVRLA
jgi:hypothetical protein